MCDAAACLQTLTGPINSSCKFLVRLMSTTTAEPPFPVRSIFPRHCTGGPWRAAWMPIWTRPCAVETRRRSNAPRWSAPNFQCIARPGHATVDGLVHEWERWGARLWRLSIHATPFALPLYARADAPDTACNRTSLKRGDERRRDWCRRRGHKPRSCCRASPPALRRGGDDVGCAHTGRYTTRPCWPTALPTA